MWVLGFRFVSCLSRPVGGIGAVGADAQGKRELDSAIRASATVIVDSGDQCVDHGETGWAVRAGLIDPAAVRELGLLLGTPRDFGDGETVVVDLTGIAVQDLAIAKAVWTAIRERAALRPLCRHSCCARRSKKAKDRPSASRLSRPAPQAGR